ncbi:hypothetical protein AJ79_06964 [Helicocarpus griseus UAMH5409]|uniref:F-box domain-containing protein n=1 Tax=Helicocarpus griseus UAMH5409 TaxID=1447875 RepID=A0A2B7X7K2_9EURO|nr:hypothetical protein AJ79_06964 [Helicocarpus griseus UAMH5409]
MASPSVAEDPPNFTRLPTELLSSIVSYLPNRDIKSLRLSCSALCGRTQLRLERVFLSANPRNIDVFRAIANHETFRKAIIEIIWDDACLVAQPQQDEDEYTTSIYYERQIEPDIDEGCLAWFSRACMENIESLSMRKGQDLHHPEHIAREKQAAAQLPMRTSWEYYMKLLQQQRDVIASNSDVDALKFGLQQFPALRRIAITPAAHGWLFEPLYETPMIREFPYGFNYPIPRGWPTTYDHQPPPVANPWSDASEEEKNQWRGFRIITRVLAQQNQHHRVSELIIDAHQLRTGLNCRIFDEPCPEYNDLTTLLEQPGFRRLDLAFTVGEQEYNGWEAFRHGYLRRALAKAPNLEHISLRANVSPDAEHDERHLDTSADYFIPLHTVFPVDRWARLQHFGLSGFLVKQDDVLTLLAALPLTLRSVELSFLYFRDGGGSYRELLMQMRDKLGWRKRAVEERPRVFIGIAEDIPMTGRYVWMDVGVAEFLYGDGENPFSLKSPNYVYQGYGKAVFGGHCKDSCKIVDLDELIPRVVDRDQEDRDVKKLVPWAFHDGDIATYNCETFCPAERAMFRSLFYSLPDYRSRLEEWKADNRHKPNLCETDITEILRQPETISLPRKNWNDVYDWVDLSVPEGLRILCRSGRPPLKYWIGGKGFASKYQGAVTVGPPGSRVPIITYTAWWEGQTLKEFLAETVSVMLGQLAANLRVCGGLCDQEVFVAGFHGELFHVSRGFFCSDVVSKCPDERMLRVGKF